MIVRNRYRYGLGALIFLICFAVGQEVGFAIGIMAAWTWLYLTATRINFPKLYYERLHERPIQFFLFLLAFTHIFAGAVVEFFVPNYLWIFLLIGGIHIALETFVILTREPKDPLKKKVKLKFRKATGRFKRRPGQGWLGY